VPSRTNPLLELVAPSVCPACDRPRREGDLLLCPRCVPGLVALSTLRGAVTALSYEGTTAELIRRLKFEERSDGLPILVAELTRRLRPIRFDGIVPVPRHWRRIRSEGCDPVFELAHGLGRAVGRPVWWRALRRSRMSPPQTGLSPGARRRGPAGTFRARPGALGGRAVLLLDDVTTTGATLRAAARELRTRGRARCVLRAAAAGTPPTGSGGASL
jgi:predicted amidophosphoribosyltransferase